MAAHIFQHTGQCIVEIAHARVTHEAGDMRQANLAVGQRMGLLVLHHLQPVFQGPQIAIVTLELFAHFGLDATFPHQGIQRALCGRLAQAGMAPAQDQLLGLGKEFDLANAAMPQLDIVAFDRDLAMTGMGVNLALDGLDVLDGGEIQIPPPDERPDIGKKAGPGLRIAGTGARLDHGGAFPVLAHGFIVIQRRIG